MTLIFNTKNVCESAQLIILSACTKIPRTYVFGRFVECEEVETLVVSPAGVAAVGDSSE